MAKKAASNPETAAANTENKSNWVSRFGTLADVMDRESKKGPYVTFKIDCAPEGKEPFSVYGACFKEDVIAQLKASVGKRIWVKGPLDTYGEGENARPSFKAIYFNESNETAEAA